jgi:dTDP-4-amino-4,6-dideoxygalactose transaminase
VPLHLQPTFKYLGYKKGDFKNSECLADTIALLPIYPEMTNEMIKLVADKVNEFYSN